MNYNPANWYWIVGDDEDNVWSSKYAALVPVSDPEYVAWLATPNHPSSIASMEELEDVLRVQYPAGSLITYTAEVRQRTNSGGITVNGRPFATDIVTLGSLNSAYIYTQSKAANEFSWKLPDGTYVVLDKAEITALQGAVSQFGQNCYACEADVTADIETGTVTTHAQIDAAFAAVPNSFTGLAVEFRKWPGRKKLERERSESQSSKKK